MLNYDPNIFFIKIENGKPVDGYITLENMNYLFPNFDPNNPPMPFVRYYKLADIERIERFTYYGEPYNEYNGKVVWQTRVIRPFTDEEREMYKLEHAQNLNDNYDIIHEQWVYNEEEGCFFAPCDPPTDGIYTWDSNIAYWVKIEDYITPE